MRKYLEAILKARVYDVAKETPLELAPRLSKRLHNQVLLKREDLQPVFSFKLRGAYNKMTMLSDQARQAGVIAASAGNHAQGVALAANRLGINSLIVMPKTTPAIKVKSVQSFGGETVLHGNSYDEAYQHAMGLTKERKLTFVHPYDDPDVIAGQGTVAMEILRQHSGPLHAVFIPVGGGGLIAGMGSYIKSLYPQIKVIGVEPYEARCMHDALKNGKRVVLDQVGIFADGVAVRQVGKEPFRLAKDCVDEVILVSTDEICAAIKDIFNDTRSIAEPAGALAIAGLKKYVQQHDAVDQVFIAIDSGANVNFDRLRHISERAELGEQRELIFAVTIPERPGSFLEFCKCIGHHSITEFNYRYADESKAHVFVGIELANTAKEKQGFFSELTKKGFEPIDMSDNEMAKVHVRYMVGGHANGANNEILYRFEFPERPGALLRFLSKMGKRWNISMFHYRNQGAAYGRVLMGIQVPTKEKDEFHSFLQEIGYTFWKESDNKAYEMFLS